MAWRSHQHDGVRAGRRAHDRGALFQRARVAHAVPQHLQHLRQLYPDDPQIAALGDDTFLLLSEPLTDMADAWEEVPESTALIARELRHFPFAPIAPGA